jgi:hypothetical protein
MTQRCVPAVLVLVLIACSAPVLPGYRHATPDERDALTRVVREYYEVFDRAQVTGDVAPLYAVHPALAHGEDRQRAINTEAWMVERVRALKVRDVHVDVESYEPMKAFVNGDAAVVYVHGLFTWTYPNGSQTKGELPVHIDLLRLDGRWTIQRTDQRVESETPEPTPR